MTEPHWTEPLELVVRKSAEHALALSWAHEASQRWCSSWNTYLFFPSVILSGLVGVGSVGASQMLPFEGNGTLIGLVSFATATLQTIQNYFAFAKRAESHRISCLQYGKLHALLSLQLSLPRNERKPAVEIIDLIQIETEKLSDVAPLIPLAVKKLFTAKFGNIDDYSIPYVLNGIERVAVTAKAEIPATPEPTARPVVRIIN